MNKTFPFLKRQANVVVFVLLKLPKRLTNYKFDNFFVDRLID